MATPDRTSRASDSPGLMEFIASAKAHDVGDGTIVALLRRNGWSERRVYREIAAYYAGILGSPVPKRSGDFGDARTAFYYLLNFLALGFWTVALGQIFYVLIAHAIADPVHTRYYDYYGTSSIRDQISWQLATVIVTFPLFAYVHRSIAKNLERRPDLYDSGVRTWLTYVALVIAACVVLTDAVWFLYQLIVGQLTLRFILDSIVLLVLGGGIFVYYLATIDGPERTSE